MTKRKRKVTSGSKNGASDDFDDDNDHTIIIKRSGYSGGNSLVLTDPINGRSYSCATKDHIIIARREGDIVIENQTISQPHCEIVRDNGQSYIRDLNSTNGTFVIANGIRYKVDGISGQELQTGDEIELGHIRLQVSEI